MVGRWRHTVLTLALMLIALVAHCASENHRSDEVLAPVLAVSSTAAATGVPTEYAESSDASATLGETSRLAIGQPGVADERRPEDRSSCPDGGTPLHEDSATPPPRVIGGMDAVMPATANPFWSDPRSPRSCASSAVPMAPGAASGTALCTELCVSRR
ncbi:hypothetical protein GCM10010472_30490 [Pseudonocardia halophobica]